jgi:hypothetical protein
MARMTTVSTHRQRRQRQARAATLAAVLVIAIGAAEPKFYPDDPLSREPETADASGAAPWDIDLYYDLAYNLFVTTRRTPDNVRAMNVNTIDEVPDSSWFTNRVGSRPVSIEELQRGPAIGPAPSPGTWTITREKSSGDAPGFTATDANGETWFVSFDSPVNPDGATGAIVIATKIFWALGYNQVEYFLTEFRPEAVKIGDKATKRRPSGRRTPMDESYIREVLDRAHRSSRGSYRAAAGRQLSGKVLGGFKYEGTRPDDPNDIVPHEHRRELRALRVFGAWTNLTDMKAGNTLDTIVTEGGRGIVRHYLQDVGSTFGVGANGPHDWNEGWEHLYEGGPSRKRLLTFGFDRSPWQTADYEEHAAVGRFEGEAFDPETWKPRAPTAAYMEMRDDDAFWAARRVMAFSDEMVRAVVATGEFADKAAGAHLAEVLIKRRDKIGLTYLTRLNPIVDPSLDASGALSFGNAAVDHRLAAPPASYAARWSTFDNATGESRPIGETKGERSPVQAPAGLPAVPGAYIQVELAADHPQFASWKQPVRVFFRREAQGWKLVGLERMAKGR